MPKYEVPIFYRGTSTYSVTAKSQAEAIEKAKELFNDGEDGDVFPDEEEIESVGKVTRV